MRTARIVSAAMLVLAAVGVVKSQEKRAAVAADTQPTRVVVRVIEDPENEPLRQALLKRVTLKVQNKPLMDVVRDLLAATNMKVTISEPDLEKLKSNLATLDDLIAKAADQSAKEAILARTKRKIVTAKIADWEKLKAVNTDVDVQNAAIGEAVSQVLQAAGLGYTLQNGAIVLTQLRKLAHPSDREEILEQLGRPVTVEFPGTNFENVIDFLNDLTGVNFVPDKRALDAEGITADTTVKLRMTNVPLETALGLILRQVNLDYTVKDGFILITNKQGVLEQALTTPLNVSYEKAPLADVLLDLGRQTKATLTVAPEVLMSLPLGGQTPITLKAQDVEARKVCEYLAHLLRARFVLTDVARYEAPSAAATARLPAVDDPIVGRVVTKGEDGRSVELFIRRSDLPAHLRTIRQAEIEALTQLLEKAQPGAKAPTTAVPSAPAGRTP